MAILYDVEQCSVSVVIFKLLSAIEKIEQNISELTRKDALGRAQDQIEAEKNTLQDKG